MKRLDDLITFLKTKPLEMPNDKYNISDASREELVEELHKIKSECAELLRKDIPVDEVGHAPSSKYVNEVGVPSAFNGWMLWKFDILVEPDEHPTLTAVYKKTI